MPIINKQHKHYLTISRAIDFLSANKKQQPSLSKLSQHLQLSPVHLQQVFSEWVGISPKQFLHALNKQQAKQLLADNSVLQTSLKIGLSSSSRLYDLMLTHEAMTPGEIKSQGKGLKIEYGHASSPFGYCFIAYVKKSSRNNYQHSICALYFFDSLDEFSILENDFLNEWVNAKIEINNKTIKELSHDIFKRFYCQGENTSTKLHLLLKGTPFQVKVWEALIKLPEGYLSSYQDIAKKIDAPNATRAVASAIAKNNIALLIPCHRVIRSTGEFNHYRWKPERKKALIMAELRKQT